MKTLQSKNILVIGASHSAIVETIGKIISAEGAAVTSSDGNEIIGAGTFDGVVFVASAPTDVPSIGHHVASTLSKLEPVALTMESAASGDRSIVIVGHPADDDKELTIPGWGAVNGCLRGISKAWAVSLGPQGIRSNFIQPGLAHTPDPEAWTVPLSRSEGRQVLPEDVANAVVFLLSEDAGYITGTELDVDGGLSEARRSLPGALWSAS
jgi:hypothetical protein